MHIKIKIHGHQYYNDISGEVVQWCSTVEHFTKGAESFPLQVPAVMINTGKEIVTVSLKRDLYWSQIEVIE